MACDALEEVPALTSSKELPIRRRLGASSSAFRPPGPLSLLT